MLDQNSRLKGRQRYALRKKGLSFSWQMQLDNQRKDWERSKYYAEQRRLKEQQAAAETAASSEQAAPKLATAADCSAENVTTPTAPTNTAYIQPTAEERAAAAEARAVQLEAELAALKAAQTHTEQAQTAAPQKSRLKSLFSRK